MQRTYRWMHVVFFMIVVSLVACTPMEANISENSEPAEIELLEGTDIYRVMLTDRAAERLGIETGQIVDTQVVRMRIVGGQVEALPDSEDGDFTQVLVRVPLNISDLNAVDQNQFAVVLPLARDSSASGLTAQLVENGAADAAEAVSGALYYLVDSADHGLVPGQRVRIELALEGTGSQQLVIPYAAVIYDLNGNTWTYTNPQPLTFVREPITVDYIEGELAVLSAGPPIGTTVVTVGVAELYGTETGVGK